MYIYSVSTYDSSDQSSVALSSAESASVGRCEGMREGAAVELWE